MVVKFFFILIIFTPLTLYPNCNWAQTVNNKTDSLLRWPHSLTSSDFTIIPDSTNTGGLDAYIRGRFPQGERIQTVDNIKHLEVFVFNNFITNKSWMKKSFINDSLLLKHEQQHFDIGEIYARRIFQKLSGFYFTANYKQEFVELMNKNDLELRQEQMRYDAETDHGRNRLQQKIWSQKIETELKDLREFIYKRGVYKINMK